MKYEKALIKYSITNPLDIVNDYTQNQFSLTDLKQKYKIPYNISALILSHHNTKLRTLLESKALEKCKHKQIQTCIERYGAENVSANIEIKKKKEKTFLKNFGVTNIRKCTKFKEHVNQVCLEKYGTKRVCNPSKISSARKKFTREKWNGIYEKYKKTCLTRYGIENPIHTGSESKIEKRVQKILIDHDVSFIKHLPYKKRVYDLFIKELNCFIEVNGDFWHANPNIYKSTDILHRPGGVFITAQEIWQKDIIKNSLIEELETPLIILWESDINQFTDQEIWQNIINEISKSKIR